MVLSSQLLGTTSVSQAVIVKNSGTSAMGLTKIAATHDFAVAGTTCGATLAGGTECLVRVVFTPTGVGARSGTLAVVDSVDSQTVALSGWRPCQWSPVTGSFGNQTVGTSSGYTPSSS